MHVQMHTDMRPVMRAGMCPDMPGKEDCLVPVFHVPLCRCLVQPQCALNSESGDEALDRIPHKDHP